MSSTRTKSDYDLWEDSGAESKDSTATSVPTTKAAAIKFAKEFCRAVETSAGSFSALSLLENKNVATAYAKATVYAQYLPYVQVETSHVVRALKRLRTFKEWGPNWDAEGAPAPDTGAIDSASELLGYLKSYPITPTAMLNALGKPLLLFQYGGREGEIIVNEQGVIDFVFDNAGGEIEAEADVEFDASALPASLEGLLDKIRAAAQ